MSAAEPSKGDMSQLLGAVRSHAAASQTRAAEHYATVESALAALPEEARTDALSALGALRDAAVLWAGRALRLQSSYEQLSTSISQTQPVMPSAATDVHSAMAQADSENAEHGNRAFGPGMCNMLIVEDSSFQAMTMLALAEESGYNAQVVASAEEALEVLEHDEDINLVLTDVMMDGAHPASRAPTCTALRSALCTWAACVCLPFEDDFRLRRCLLAAFALPSFGSTLRRLLRPWLRNSHGSATAVWCAGPEQG